MQASKAVDPPSLTQLERLLRRQRLLKVLQEERSNHADS